MGKKKNKQAKISFNTKRAQKGLHKLLRQFGYNADKVVMAYLQTTPGINPRRFCITIRDVTDVATPDNSPLVWKIDGEIRREKTN